MDVRAPFEDYNREFDVVVYGATGFTGELAAEHMCDYYLTSNGEYRVVKFALAGRSRQKLEDVLVRISRRLNKPLDIVPLLIADSTDPDSLSSMCERARVVATTVGPYLAHGEALVAACVKCKTHYCDLTGELPFVAKVFRTYGQRAAERGLKIVHACGWMSVAADLSCLLVENASLLRAGRPCEEVEAMLHYSRVKCAVTKLHGGVSGGTLASVAELLEDPSMHDRYYLCTHGLPGNLKFSPPEKKPPSVKFWGYDKDFGYTGMYIGAPLDEAIVRHPGLLPADSHGKWHTSSSDLVTYSLGPSRDTLETGYYEMRTVGRTPLKNPESNSWKALRTEVVFAGDSDPGYHGAAKMLCEAAVCMAEEMDECTSLCGVLSPGAGIGEALEKRLRDRGIHIKVECVDDLPEGSPSK